MRAWTRCYPWVVRPEKWQRNAIYEAVAAGVDARACTFDYDDAAWRITHVPSGSSFLIQGDPPPYNTIAAVGDGLPRPSESFSWPRVPEKVQRWAEEVQRDVDTPDLWAELRRARGFLPGIGDEDLENTPFSSGAQAEIVEQVRQIKEFVRQNYSLSEAQTLSVEVKLDGIAAAARRMGRKDWLLMFGGVILSATLADLLPPEAVWDILAMASRGLGHLFGGGGGGAPPQLHP